MGKQTGAICLCFTSALRFVCILLIFFNCVSYKTCHELYSSGEKLQYGKLGQVVHKVENSKSTESRVAQRRKDSFGISEKIRSRLHEDPFDLCSNEHCLDAFIPKHQTHDQLHPNKLPIGWIDPFDMSTGQDVSGWVDPFDMTPTAESSRPIPKTQFSCNGNCDLYVSYFKRFISLFLKSVDCKTENSENLSNCNLEFELTLRDSQILQNFSENKVKEDNSQKGVKIEAVLEVLARIMPQKFSKERSKYFDFNLGVSLSRLGGKTIKFINKLVTTPEWTVVSSVLIMLIATLWFTHAHSYRLALFTLFITIFFGGFGVTWLRMCEEKEVERYASMVEHGGNAPYHCTRNPMVWYEHMYYKIFGTDCREFLKMRDVQTVLKVSPSDVLAETISSMFVNPATNFGKAYGSFVEGVTTSAPFYLKPIAMLMAFILPLCFTVILFCFLFSYEVTISPLYFYLKPSVYFSGAAPISETSKMDKKYIEDISQKESKTGIISSSGSFCDSLFVDNKKPLFLITNSLGLKTLTGNESPTDDASISNQNIIHDEENETTARRNPIKDQLNEIALSPTTNKTAVNYRAIKFADEMGIEEELHSILLYDCECKTSEKICDCKNHSNNLVNSSTEEK